MLRIPLGVMATRMAGTELNLSIEEADLTLVTDPSVTTRTGNSATRDTCQTSRSFATLTRFDGLTLERILAGTTT